ncbi:hypothetical protein SAMN05518861_109164 [Mesorhizobium sp. YR577]|jgi:hypothetical protein|nr:hypothetical protein SAMN05518861_109164 [Mesorhizobium sp. YR577]
MIAPSPSRCARHLSPASQGRGTGTRRGRNFTELGFLAPMKWGRGGSGKARDGEGAPSTGLDLFFRQSTAELTPSGCFAAISPSRGEKALAP